MIGNRVGNCLDWHLDWNGKRNRVSLPSSICSFPLTSFVDNANFPPLLLFRFPCAAPSPIKFSISPFYIHTQIYFHFLTKSPSLVLVCPTHHITHPPQLKFIGEHLWSKVTRNLPKLWSLNGIGYYFYFHDFLYFGGIEIGICSLRICFFWVDLSKLICTWPITMKLNHKAT